MYESFFDLSSRPFPAAPLVEFYFPTPVIEQARQTLIRIVDRAEGPGLIIGQPGLGKTLLLRMLNHHFQNVFHCIHLASAAIDSRKDLLQNVLFELDLPYRNMEEGELRLSLLDFLRPSESCPHGVLLLVDEAHTLPLQLLDEIRMITNLVRDGQPRVRLVLAGDSQLEDIFADPRLDSFNQRIAARCYLEPLNQEQTIEYVQSQITAIGGTPSDIFTPEALVAVHLASGGIPRVINQVCDHSLVMASLGGYHQLDAAGIEEAWSDLQQLPGPWNDPAVPANTSSGSIVEFGSLDEDDAEVAAGGNTSQASDEVAAASIPAANRINSTDNAIVPDPKNETPVISDVLSSSLPASNSQDLLAHDGDLADNFSPAVTPVTADEDVAASAVIQIGCEADSFAAWGEEAREMDTPTDNTPTDKTPAQTPAATTAITPIPVTESAAALTLESAVEPGFVDPFDQGFDEEEVVVDRYADLNGSVFSGCPQVSSEEGRALAAMITSQPSPRLTVVDAELEVDDEAALDEPTADDTADNTSDEAHFDDDRDRDREDVTQQDELIARGNPVATTDAHERAAGDADAAPRESASLDYTAAEWANNVFDTSSLSAWLFESATATVGVGPTTASDAPTTGKPRAATPVVSKSEPAAVIAKAVDPEPAAPVAKPAAVAKEVAQPSFLQVHAGSHFEDDRDMIVIDDDKHEGVFLTQTGDDLARRVEYQQLFSQLRES